MKGIKQNSKSTKCTILLKNICTLKRPVDIFEAMFMELPSQRTANKHNNPFDFAHNKFEPQKFVPTQIRTPFDCIHRDPIQ